MILPKFITFTGVDSQTNLDDLLMLAADYPVEFGVLLSASREGTHPRYPSQKDAKRIVSSVGVSWSAHLCGKDAKDVFYAVSTRHGEILEYCSRMQVNTSERLNEVDHRNICLVAASYDVKPILQCRGNFPPAMLLIDVLYDKSGGKGVTQEFWPETVPMTFCGYAGGMNPDNVREIVQSIGSKAKHPYWIDMESGVRDHNDRFDLSKCRKVCEAVYGEPQCLKS